MRKLRTFIVSSSELSVERKEVALFLYRENKSLVDKGVFLDLVIWEELLHSFRGGRIQDYFNREMLKCDIVIALFFKKVGQFSKEEFDLAYRHLRNGRKPSYLFAYFKTGDIPIDEIDDDVEKIKLLKELIKSYGQIYSSFNSIEDLSLQLKRQFDQILTEYVVSETHQEVTHAIDSMTFSDLAPDQSYSQIKRLYEEFERSAMTGKPEDVKRFTNFIEKKYFPFLQEYSKRNSINYVTYWDQIFRNDGVLSQIEVNIEEDNEIEELHTFRRSIMFSNLVPVQSYEQYQNEYERLETLSIEGGIENFERFMAFLQKHYFPFMKAYMGGKNNDYIALWDKVFGKNGSISIIKEKLKG